jgi:hypothetical protein
MSWTIIDSRLLQQDGVAGEGDEDRDPDQEIEDVRHALSLPLRMRKVPIAASECDPERPRSV